MCSEFVVDFGNKTLEGTLSNWDDGEGKAVSWADTIKFDAKIQANTFKGETVTKINETKMTRTISEGKFYGPNADNLAGSFSHNPKYNGGGSWNPGPWRNISGVFGANKQ